MDIYLCKMTKSLLRAFFQGFTNDPCLYEDESTFSEYIYCEAAVDSRWERQQQLGQIHLAVMLDGAPIGEVILKNPDGKSATLSIHMKNDRVKNQGYGTQAEILTLRYAFETLGLNTVFADAIVKNRRSQHVLEKAGFQITGSDEHFRYYRCDRENWNPGRLGSGL